MKERARTHGRIDCNLPHESVFVHHVKLHTKKALRALRAPRRLSIAPGTTQKIIKIPVSSYSPARTAKPIRCIAQRVPDKHFYNSFARSTLFDFNGPLFGFHSFNVTQGEFYC